MNLKNIGTILGASVSLLILGSCTTNPDSSGLEYMPDMYRSPAIEPYVDYGEIRGRENVKLTMTQSALTPPMNTVPYAGNNMDEVLTTLPWNILPNSAFKQTHGLKGFDFTDEDTYNTKALALTKNPIALEGENGEVTFKSAKKLYQANCAHCHGDKGDGKGPMMTNGTYVGVPNYADKKALSDGQIFYSIYYGKGAMGAHAYQLNKKEIWDLVHYVRKFQDKDYGKGANLGGVQTETAVVEQMDWEHVNIEEQRGKHMGLHITYKDGSSAIDMTKSKQDLENVLKFMKDYPEVNISLDGHTSSSGTVEANNEISKERAEAVKNWLVKNGVSGERIETNGFGSQFLVKDENGSEDAAASRRTELIIK